MLAKTISVALGTTPFPSNTVSAGQEGQNQAGRQGSDGGTPSYPFLKSFGAADRARCDRFGFEPMFKINREGFGRGISFGALFGQALKTNRLQVAIYERIPFRRGTRVRLEHLADRFKARPTSEGGMA